MLKVETECLPVPHSKITDDYFSDGFTVRYHIVTRTLQLLYVWKNVVEDGNVKLYETRVRSFLDKILLEDKYKNPKFHHLAKSLVSTIRERLNLRG